jgi:hypothetical protein
MPRPTDAKREAAPGHAPDAANFGQHEIATPGSNRRGGYISHPERKVKPFRARLPREMRRGTRR